jgi:uncharacterized protein (TIGR00255 family)
MTAFARIQTTLEQGEITWELRSVNHRFLETYMKMPEDFRSGENRFREIVQHRIKRGKVECFCRFNINEENTFSIEINKSQAKALVDACHEIDGMLHQPSDVNPMDVLRWPGIVHESKLDTRELISAAEKGLIKALEELIANRAREGERMREVLLQRIGSMQAIVDEVRKSIPDIQQRYQQKVRDRLRELQVEVNNDRLEQEVVHMLQKMDVDEELDRLDSHLKEIADVLDRDDAVGRRLDFLMQELNREANTLGSKSADISSTNASVELKVLIEQMREQIQNIE